MKEARISSIDTLRVFAAFAVVCIHTAPFYPLGVIHPYYKIISYMIMSVCRFAVPFFFLSAGYFYGKSLSKEPQPLARLSRSLKRVGILFLAWCLIYAILPQWIPLQSMLKHGIFYEPASWLISGPREALLKVQGDPLNFLFEGTALTLWFLTALMCAYAILTFFVVIRKPNYLLPISIALFLFGLLNSFYVPTPLGIYLPFEFYFRNGPFFSTFFVYAGWRISTLAKPPLSAKAALFLMLGGFLMQEIEVLVIAAHYGVSPKFDYVIGTIPLSLGLFLLALAKPGLGENTVFPRLAVFALGIYLFHPYLKTFVLPLSNFFNPFLWQFLYPVLVFLIALIVVSLLRKTERTKFLVV